MHIDAFLKLCICNISSKKSEKNQKKQTSDISFHRQTSNYVQQNRALEMLSLSECIPWMSVGLAESLAIITLNLCTVMVFIRNRNLRKRSTYLVINLAVIDMFVGFAVVYNLFYLRGVFCNLWNWNSTEVGTIIFIRLLMLLFTFGSLINIAIIALERVHATFFPFNNRVLKVIPLRLFYYQTFFETWRN